MRVGLLECDHVDERWRGIDGDYGDMTVVVQISREGDHTRVEASFD